MTSISLADADKIYKYADECKIIKQRVPYIELGDFSKALHALRAQLHDLANDEYWKNFFRPLRQFQFDLCAAPLQNECRDSCIIELERDLKRNLIRCKALYPDFFIPASNVLEKLLELANKAENPLLTSLLNICKFYPERNIAWVVKESRLIPHVEDIIISQPTLHQVKVLHPSELNDIYFFETIILIGSPKWFPDSIFTAPRASEIRILNYTWMKDTWELHSVFIDPYKPANTRQRAVLRESAVHEIEELNIPEDSLLSSPDNHTELVSQSVKNNVKDYDTIEAKCLILEAGNALFVEADNDASMLIIDLEEEAAKKVKRVSIKELQPGNFVLVKTGGGGDYIVPIADQIMGEKAATARKCQQHWKSLLKQYVIEHGLFATSYKLLELGSPIAEEANLRNWIHPRGIKTQNFVDFNAIMRLIGLEHKAPEYWQIMEVIRNAHRSAGVRVRDLLLEHVQKSDLSMLKRRGMMDFRLSEDQHARLTAYRVESILPQTYRVAYSRIAEIFKLGK